MSMARIVTAISVTAIATGLASGWRPARSYSVMPSCHAASVKVSASSGLPDR